jgi:hypothetical protein
LNGSQVWPCSTSPPSIRWNGGWCSAGAAGIGVDHAADRRAPFRWSGVVDRGSMERGAWRRPTGRPRRSGRGDAVRPRVVVFGIWSPANAVVDVKAVPSIPGSSPMAGRRSSVGTAPAAAGIGAVDCPTGIRRSRVSPTCPPPGSPASIRVPVAASSSRLFEAEWTVAAATDRRSSRPFARMCREPSSGVLESRLPFTLRECSLFHAGWTYEVGVFDPGSRSIRSRARDLARSLRS